MLFKIEIEGLEEVKNFYYDLATETPRMLMEAINETAIYMGQKAGENLQKRIYAQPPSKYYERTGSAGRGHEVNTIKDGYEVRFSTVLGGAETEYDVFLNKNSRVSRLHTLFFDDAYTEAEEKLSQYIQAKFREL
jgi:hypothetical protein